MGVAAPTPSVETGIRRVRRLLDDAGASLVGARVLALCSGGADSVALVALLAGLPRGARPASIDVAWCDHGLRDDVAAERDAARAAAETVGAPFHELVAPSGLDREPGGVEAAARTWRLEATRTLAEQLGCTHVATGHTADDQLEQALLALVGVTGSAGAPDAMRVVRPLAPGVELVRPLLACTRAQVEGVLAELGLPWAQDPTNLDADAHVRNAVRHRVVPELLAVAGGAGAALVRAGARERDANDVMRELAAGLLAAWGGGATLDVRLLAGLAAGTRRTLIAEWLRAAGLGRGLGSRHVEAVERLAVGPSRPGSCGRVDLAGTACVRRDGYHLTFTRSCPGGPPS